VGIDGGATCVIASASLASVAGATAAGGADGGVGSPLLRRSPPRSPASANPAAATNGSTRERLALAASPASGDVPSATRNAPDSWDDDDGGAALVIATIPLDGASDATIPELEETCCVPELGV
jgi:hypothetical protein